MGLKEPAGSSCCADRAGSLWLHLQIQCHWPPAPLRRRPSLWRTWNGEAAKPHYPSDLSHVGVLRMVSTANHRSSKLAAECRSPVQRVLFWWRFYQELAELRLTKPTNKTAPTLFSVCRTRLTRQPSAFPGNWRNARPENSALGEAIFYPLPCLQAQDASSYAMCLHMLLAEPPWSGLSHPAPMPEVTEPSTIALSHLLTNHWWPTNFITSWLRNLLISR